MVRRLSLALLSICTGAAVVVLLYCLTPPEPGAGGFSRTAGRVSVKRIQNLSHRGYYVAGYGREELVLGNRYQPHDILVLRDTVLHAIPIACDSVVAQGRLHVATDHFVLHDALRKKCYAGSTATWKPEQVFPVPSGTADAVIFSPTTIVYRQQRYHEAKTVIFRNADTTRRNTFIPDRQVDGLFCTDGILLTEPKRNLVAYVYYYRNEIILLDSSLRFTNRYHTIDTVRHALIRVREVHGNRTTFSAPPVFVNRHARIADSLILVLSHVRSLQPEEPSHHHKYLDLYSSLTGKYLYTLYVPDYRGEPVRDFQYYQGNLIAVHGPYLVTYSITGPG